MTPVVVRNLSDGESGFTLIEVMVAVLVLSVGIFGLIALESFTLKNNQSAYLRSQATILIYDMADKMRANRQEDYWTISPSSHAGSCYSTGSACTTTQIAERDMYEWEKSIEAILPNGLGVVSQAVSGDINVSISWDDDRDSATGTFGREATFAVDFQL